MQLLLIKKWTTCLDPCNVCKEGTIGSGEKNFVTTTMVINPSLSFADLPIMINGRHGDNIDDQPFDKYFAQCKVKKS